MPSKLSPENIIANFIKSATNGRAVSPKLRRILTIIIFPIWVLGLAFYLWVTIDMIMYNDMIKHPIRFLDFDEAWSIIYFILIAFIIPFIILKLTFWVIDADREKLNN